MFRRRSFPLSAITLDQARANLTAWLQADQAVASSSQAHTIETGGFRRQVTRADAAEIRNNITYWSAMVARLEAGGIRVRRAVPV